MSGTPRPSQGLTENSPTTSRILPLPDNLVADTSSSRSTVPSKRFSIRERFVGSRIKARTDEDDQDGIRGPMGLRLVHSSPEPLIDLIFVHGLRGGSIKTWRQGNDPRMFWPQFWLPKEPGLRNVSVHSFGYDSDWASIKPSILNVHDFGQSLLEEMRNSPHLRKNPSGPIILLGHSMGGLVIKKAYYLARDVPDLGDRIKCIFFLATPHRGSDYAALLNNILAATGVMSSRHYITDLTIGSTSAEQINKDFRKHAKTLPIFSFYETLRMNLGFTSGLIVERSSAILGPSFENERVQYINANHREICKFDSMDDPSYITIKNALSSAVEDLLKDASNNAMIKSKEQTKILKSYLGISDRPDVQFSAVNGTCQWIHARQDFQDWRDLIAELSEDEGELRKPSIFWVHANPGMGKTYLAAHVVSKLQNFQFECAYYHFHVGSKSSRSLAEFLRSMAYQMASSNASIRQKLISMQDEGLSFDPEDVHSIWTKLFKRGVFQSDIRTPQYWVVDALDECSKYQELFAAIKGEKLSFPLRIFITSRNIPDIRRLCHLSEPSATITSIEIPVEDSMDDIRCYVQSRIEDLQPDIIDNKEDLMNRIVERSNASFLWVRLVLDELGQVYSKEGILEVLQSIPEGMIPYYQRIVGVMAEKKSEKSISKAILLWTVTTYRSLTISELSQALNLDIGVNLPNAKSVVEGLCGQLVSVDTISGTVNLVHPIAREFLLSEAAGEFSISASLAHERIALACLQLLCSNELQPPRNRRLLGTSAHQKEHSSLLDYAITEFSEHICHASVENDELLLLLDRLFRMNVLSWIEKVSQKGDLYCLIRASRNLKAYLGRRINRQSSLSSQVKNIDEWSTDLSRIVARFGVALLGDPSSIYFVIPPLCPSNSITHQRFGKRPDGLEIVGFKQSTWDECVALTSLSEDTIPATVFCGERHIAVGMESGDVCLYEQHGFKKVGVINYTYPIDLVHVIGKYVAVCTIRSVAVKGLEGNVIWEKRLKFRCILLTSFDNSLIGVTQHGHLLKWDLSSGAPLEDQVFTYKTHSGGPEQAIFGGKAPALASISPDMEILALAYADGTVCIWDIPTGELIGWAADEENKSPSVLMFNPNSNIPLLLAIYANHDMSLYDTWSMGLVNSYKTAEAMGILSASCSPDGRTLATADTRWNLQIWDFESLSQLHHILSPAESFRLLGFTSDSSSVVDVTDSNMRIWSPTALIRKHTEYESSDSTITPVVTKGHYDALRISRITAVCAHHSLPIVFAGKFTGQIIAFDTQTGQQVSTLYSHSPEACVKEIIASEGNIIASVDANDVVQVWRLATDQHGAIVCESQLLQVSLSAWVKQLCFSTNSNYLLAAKSHEDLVYSMKDGSCVGTLPFNPYERRVWRWVREFERGGEEQFLLLSNHTLQRYSADAFPLVINNSEIHLEYQLPIKDSETTIHSASIHDETQTLILEIHFHLEYVYSSTVLLFNLGSVPDDKEEGIISLNAVPLHHLKHFIGFGREANNFVFLHRDSWLCSTDIDSITTKQLCRHFLIPNEYIPSDRQILAVRGSDDSIVFCLHGELSIFKNGLRFREIQTIE
ncbi:NACHT and WD domain protein [Hypoxylon trugodes]|uniref:NACHT and WD domain protein n=1 Tax=Hypoxylon trugodes TaxID=326681 RepID=UPI00219ABF4A|nr:NACHT and WD domain protein [Hypoxylon trugodes]KAI1391831.1 NACHT and WD domain protein [Hypoxylon trugodes]